jgi:hypothetical protein
LIRGLVFLIILFASTGAWAVSSSLWETDSKADFDAGEPDGVSVLPTGRIVLGPKTQETLLDPLFAWTLAEDSKGNIYVGTGSDGKIFRISPKGKSELFAEPELQQVFALIRGPKGVLYAGGFPGGKIYSIDKKGEISEYFDTGQDAVWSLCLNGDGMLVAGTGDEGKIFKVTAEAEGSLVYDSPERRILSLFCDADGTIYAGSEQNGIIYKIGEDEHPFVFYDTDLAEITSMTMDDDGYLYAVSSPGELFAKIPPRAAPAAPNAAGNTSAAHPPQATAGPAAAPSMPAIPSGKKRKCFIYKISEDGVASKFWESPDKLIFSLAFDGDSVLAGSGNDGIVYKISPEGEDSKYHKVDQKQVLAMLRLADGRIAAATGNDAAITVLGKGYAAEGTFVSQVHDATAVSKWGRVFWESFLSGRTKVSISTRTGNSGHPDDTWSDWTRERIGAEGFVPELPVARFIQWRARLETADPDKTPVIEKMTVAYLQKNFPPTITSISVDGNDGKKKNGASKATAKGKGMPAGAPTGKAANVAAKVSSGGVKGVPASHKTKLKIKWKAKDKNGDDLEYDLYFKGVEEKRWKLIKDELTAKAHDWDTEAVPDGEYHLKVVASDLPANPEQDALTDEKASEPFFVDNTSPVVSSLRPVRAGDASGYKITGAVGDNLSPVRSAHYSIDAGEWMSVFSADGIFDSQSERVEFEIGQLEPGEHTIVLKAIDYFGNVGSGKITFEVK